MSPVARCNILLQGRVRRQVMGTSQKTCLQDESGDMPSGRVRRQALEKICVDEGDKLPPTNPTILNVCILHALD